MALRLKILTIQQYLLNVKRLTVLLSVIAIASAIGIAYAFNRVQQINDFNKAVLTGNPPQIYKQSLEAKFSTAYWLAKNERYKEATLLYSQLSQKGTPAQRAKIFHNVGNMFYLKSLRVSGGNDPRVRDEVEYLLIQAHDAYKQSLKLDHTNWGTRRNLDRVLTLLPDAPTAGLSDSDSPGLIMGNIPVGLP